MWFMLVTGSTDRWRSGEFWPPGHWALWWFLVSPTFIPDLHLALARSPRDLSRVMTRLKALYRSWAIPCAGRDVY